MNENSYNQYLAESSGWLHTGRSALIARILGFFVPRDQVARDILEIGAGAGQNVPVLGRHGVVDVLELDEKGLVELHKRTDVRKIIDRGIPCPLERPYDIICAFDVIEHIEDDRGAMRWIADNLKPGGLCLVTVPAHPWFFTRHDQALGHHRRYTRQAFRDIIPTELERLADSHFNTVLFPLAILARWAWVARHLFTREVNMNKQPAPGQGLHSRLLLSVFLKEIEATRPDTSRTFGLSYYACLRKKA